MREAVFFYGALQISLHFICLEGHNKLRQHLLKNVVRTVMEEKRQISGSCRQLEDEKTSGS